MKFKFNRLYLIVSWVIFTVFMITVLPNVALATEEAGLIGSIDTNFSFDPNSILQIIIDYGPEGRRYYLIQRWTFDTIYPLVYALPLAFSIWGLLLRSKYIRWAWLPMFAASFDYFENITYSLVMLSFPNIGVNGVILGLVILGVILSAIKWLLLGSSYMMVLGLLAIGFIKKLMRLIGK